MVLIYIDDCFYSRISYAFNGLVYLLFTLFSHGSIEIKDSNNTIKFKTNS